MTGKMLLLLGAKGMKKIVAENIRKLRLSWPFNLQDSQAGRNSHRPATPSLHGALEAHAIELRDFIQIHGDTVATFDALHIALAELVVRGSS